MPCKVAPTADPAPTLVPRHGALEHAKSAPFVGGHIVAFNADDRNHVEMSTQKLKISRPNECSVGEYRENHVLYL